MDINTHRISIGTFQPTGRMKCRYKFTIIEKRKTKMIKVWMILLCFILMNTAPIQKGWKMRDDWKGGKERNKAENGKMTENGDNWMIGNDHKKESFQLDGCRDKKCKIGSEENRNEIMKNKIFKDMVKFQ